MKPSREYIDHTADILFQAQAPTLEQLFEQCALAVEETQIPLEEIQPSKTITIELKHKQIDRLLFDFLDDLLFHKDADLLVFSKFDLNITKNEEYHLMCKASGEPINHEKHERKVDVKAITMHLFEVKQVEGGWTAQVILDI